MHEMCQRKKMPKINDIAKSYVPCIPECKFFRQEKPQPLPGAAVLAS
jgi:hypothetical protein